MLAGAQAPGRVTHDRDRSKGRNQTNIVETNLEMVSP